MVHCLYLGHMPGCEEDQIDPGVQDMVSGESSTGHWEVLFEPQS